jgi:hypothetical protein
MAHNQKLQEEIVVTSLTLSYQMAVRTGTILNLAGALIARPGHEPKAGSSAARTVPFSSSRESTAIGQPQAEASEQPANGTQPQSAI